ncbi:hypothetical protein J4416_04490 [Candidatus Pacearchaeota archaeon]|nr:hypothetical protein [Candidatus Pacearchaeota archaeon]
MKVILIVVKIFVIAALLIISNQSLAISDSSNRQHFVDEYSVWISHLVENSLSIVSYVVKNEWLPETR